MQMAGAGNGTTGQEDGVQHRQRTAIYEWVGSVVVALLINAMKTLPPKNPPPPPSLNNPYLFI